MTIDWAHFTPWRSLAGGVLLGVAVCALVLLNGRVLGVSSVLRGLMKPGDRGWRMALLLGLLAAPWVWQVFAPAVAPRMQGGPLLLLVAGLLVGWGTSEGSGCTSGHGVCGLSRLSPRSIVATLAFMATGFATVFVVRHWIAGGA